MEHMIIDTLFLFNIADMYFHIKKKSWLGFYKHWPYPLYYFFQKKNILVVSFASHCIHKRFQEKDRIGYILGVICFGATDCIIMDFSSSVVSGFREKKKGMQ